MCAIAGLVGLDAEEKTLDRMLKTMARRGPDDRGVSASPGCTLLHTRLAIIDPAGGKQPMRLTHNGETYTLVYNGELYNTAEIRAALQKLGVSWVIPIQRWCCMPMPSGEPAAWKDSTASLPLVSGSREEAGCFLPGTESV